MINICTDVLTAHLTLRVFNEFNSVKFSLCIKKSLIGTSHDILQSLRITHNSCVWWRHLVNLSPHPFPGQLCMSVWVWFQCYGNTYLVKSYQCAPRRANCFTRFRPSQNQTALMSYFLPRFQVSLVSSRGRSVLTTIFN